MYIWTQISGMFRQYNVMCFRGSVALLLLGGRGRGGRDIRSLALSIQAEYFSVYKRLCKLFPVNGNNRIEGSDRCIGEENDVEMPMSEDIRKKDMSNKDMCMMETGKVFITNPCQGILSRSADPSIT